MEKKRVALLQAELQSRIQAIANIYLKLDDRKGRRGKVAVESLAYQIHNLYCAFEEAKGTVPKQKKQKGRFLLLQRA